MALREGGPLPLSRLLDVRTVSGEPGLYLGGRRLGFRGNGRLLLSQLLKSPGMCAPNDEIEQLIWPRQRGDLGARRRELVGRMNAKLKRELQMDQLWTKGAALPIDSSEHATRLNLDVGRG